MSLEWNKLFAALLVAGIVAKMSGFVADKVYHEAPLEKNAYEIEVVEAAASGGTAEEPKVEPILALLANADLTQGEKLSKACAACHSFTKGGANGIGPNMWNVVGREKGQVSGFAYSDALMQKGGGWTYENLNEFLWKPKKYIEGTKMNYIGLKKPEDRAAVIAWLRTLSDSPIALPSAAQIEAEQAALAPAVVETPADVAAETSAPETSDATPDTTPAATPTQ